MDYSHAYRSQRRGCREILGKAGKQHCWLSWVAEFSPYEPQSSVETLPKLSQVRCYDLYPEATRCFIEEMGPGSPGSDLMACSNPAEMIEGADVVVTAIPIVTKPAPALHPGMLRKVASPSRLIMIRHGAARR